jgi:polyisoprenyl-teichoic acid--peptidoglycan teichoic acid transferase
MRLVGVVVVAGLLLGTVGAVLVTRSVADVERFAFDPDRARDRLAGTGEALEAAGAGPTARDPAPAPPPRDPPASRSRDGVETVVVLGSDAREGLAGARADVILVLLLRGGAQGPVLFSLPRDLWVHNPCTGGPSRLNAGLNGCGAGVSGAELMAVLVEDVTGLEVDHLVEVDFTGFAEVIDLAGGLEICSDRPLRDRELSLPGGCVDADGELALAWVRSRKTQELVDGRWRTVPGVSDLTRNERQQEVLLQLLERLRTVRSPGQLHALTDAVAEVVALSDTLSVPRLAGMAWRARDLQPSDVRRLVVEVEPYRTSGGAQVLLLTEPVPVTLERTLEEVAAP